MTGAELLLRSLKRNGIDYLFANAGTDFPPIIEALSALDANEVPVPITVAHETAGIGMAHGYYLVTGKPQATMVHVNVGLANTAMGVINAASDNIPVIVLSGRTPITELGHAGSRATPIQYGQEMYDQSSLVSDVVKFHYEMRYPDQADALVTRAMNLSTNEPQGPVYISMPREPLMDSINTSIENVLTHQVRSSAPHPNPDAIAQAAQWLQKAKHPVVVCQRGDTAGKVAAALSAFAQEFAIPVVEPFVIRNVMASEHPAFIGYDIKQALSDADVILVLDSAVPWIESVHKPTGSTRIIHLGPDPHFQRMPVRGYQIDLAICSDAAAGINALRAEMQAAMSVSTDKHRLRLKQLAQQGTERRSRLDAVATQGCSDPMTAEWLSACLSKVMDDNTVMFSELGVVPSAMNLAGPNRLFCNPHSGGLGWALPAALGAQLADRNRLCIACVGDGSYMFANPVACHQICEALELPVLIVIKNNASWNAVRRSVKNSYPDGEAIKRNVMPLTSLEPIPDFVQIARASRVHAEQVTTGDQLPEALARAVQIIRAERRSVLLDVRVAVSDNF